MQIEADCAEGGAVAQWSDFVYDSASRRRLICGMILQTGQMCTGIDSIMFFGPAIFAQVRTKRPHLIANEISNTLPPPVCDS